MCNFKFITYGPPNDVSYLNYHNLFMQVPFLSISVTIRVPNPWIVVWTWSGTCKQVMAWVTTDIHFRPGTNRWTRRVALPGTEFFDLVKSCRLFDPFDDLGNGDEVDVTK